MGLIKMNFEHSLGEDEAQKRIKGLFQALKNEYRDKMKELKESWNGNVSSFSFSLLGFSIAGNINVSAKNVAFSFDLPFAAMIFKGEVEKSINVRVRALLA